jgi:hypothetical protein
MLDERNINYIFTAHDIHPLTCDKRDDLFTSHVRAIDNSLMTIVPGEHAIDHYSTSSHKMKFLSHGVNTSFYKDINNNFIDSDNVKLLCIGKNESNVINNDRKGYLKAIEAARRNNISITVAGPNSEWLEKVGLEESSYEKLKIIDKNFNKEEMKQLMDEHDILMHLSMIETGEPCLVILESISMGLPAIATTKDCLSIEGIEFVGRNDEGGIDKAINNISNNYEYYKKNARNSAVEKDWSKIAVELSELYEQANGMAWHLTNAYLGTSRNRTDNNRFLICFDSKSLGDNIAWMPYAEEFRKKHDCKVVLSTFWNDLFEKEYPDIEFIGRGEIVHNIQGQYNIGWYMPWDANKNPNDFRTIPLQQTASDILGLEYKEIRPKITIPQ